MKRLFLVFLVCVIAVACSRYTGRDATATNPTPPNAEQAKVEIAGVLESMHNSLKAKDTSFIEKYLATDGIYLGTDPGEVLGFAAFKDFLSKQMSSASFNPEYNVADRKIEVHGPSATIIEQYMLPLISSKVMVRNIGHARYENGKWILDLYSWNMIPKNEDMPVIDKALSAAH